MNLALQCVFLYDRTVFRERRGRRVSMFRTFNWANLSAVLARGVASSRSCLEPLNPDQPVNQFNYGLLLLVSLLIFY